MTGLTGLSLPTAIAGPGPPTAIAAITVAAVTRGASAKASDRAGGGSRGNGASQMTPSS